MNLFDLFARITLDDDDYKKKLGDNEKHTSSFADKLKAGFSAVGKAAAVGLAAAGSAVVAVGKAAVDSYADYEQLVGGVQTLFGLQGQSLEEYAASVGKSTDEALDEWMKYTTGERKILNNAEKAYKTAGLSMNDYMETVTSFSASLIASLDGDTAAAADYADQAIIDMADNANKMGTSMESLQATYAGFAKQNFVMLDNLKLGYGGTKEEMQRLLDDAGKIAGVEFDISSFADITQAIHVMQVEMGIAGATAAEAEGTISGSLAAMKAAWSNLVTGLADENADIDSLIGTFIDTVGVAADNIVPVVERVLGNVFQALADNAPALLQKAVELFMQLAAGALRAIPGIIAAIPQIIESIISGFKESWPDIVNIGKEIVTGLWEGIKAMGSWIKDKVSGFFSGIVDNVKGLLGIHSPSRVFAEMGGFMAEGLGEGWDKKYDAVKHGIEDGLHFNAGTVDFASSAVGVSSAGIINGFASAGRDDGKAVEVVLKLPDNTELARYYLPSFIDVARANGTPIANPL